MQFDHQTVELPKIKQKNKALPDGGRGYEVDNPLVITDSTNTGFGAAGKVTSTTADQVTSIAVTITPAAVVAVIVSPIVNKPDLSVITNSMMVIVPNLLLVTFETKAVESEVTPVIVRPLKLK